MSATKFQLLRVEEQEGVPVVALQCSELRGDSVIARVEQEVEEFLAASKPTRLVLDLSAVHFISSGGLRVLIVLRKRMNELGGRFTMCGVQPHVAGVFRTTRLFTDSFDYLSDASAAVAALKDSPPR